VKARRPQAPASKAAKVAEARGERDAIRAELDVARAEVARLERDLAEAERAVKDAEALPDGPAPTLSGARALRAERRAGVRAKVLAGRAEGLTYADVGRLLGFSATYAARLARGGAQ
jgi:hypothetical protein